MFRLSKILKDWKESGALQAHINLYGFWDDETFLTKSGDLGMVLRAKGIDYESLDHASRDHAVKRLEAALRTFDPRVRVYQALFKTMEPAIPHQQYANPLVKAAIDQRMAYFASKADQLYSIDLYWIVLIQGSYARSTVWQALAKLPTDIGGSLRDVAALFSQDQQRTLLRTQIERDHIILRQKVLSLIGQLSDLVEIQLLGAEEAFRTLRRFINFGPFKIMNSQLHGSWYLDFQLCDSEIEAHRGYLQLDEGVGIRGRSGGLSWQPQEQQMQTIDLEMTQELSDALFNSRESSILREPNREGLLDYGSGRARAGLGATRGGRKKTEPKRGHRNGRPGQYGQRGPSDVATRPLGHRQAPASSGNHQIPELSMSDATSSLPDRIEQHGHALTASELAELLAVSRITVFKLAKAGRIPCFRVGTCVRFDPRAVAKWLRSM